MAGMELKQLPMASSVKLNRVVRCLHGSLKYLHSRCSFTGSGYPPDVTASELALAIFHHFNTPLHIKARIRVGTQKELQDKLVKPGDANFS